jgi:hypothetical protein
MPYRPRKRKTTKKGTKSTKPKASTTNVDALIAYVHAKMPEGISDLSEWRKKYTEHRFHDTRKWRFDIGIERIMLAIEYEGMGRKSRHTSYNGFIADAEKYSTAAAMGWWVLRFCHTHVKTGECFAIIDQALGRLTGEKNGTGS